MPINQNPVFRFPTEAADEFVPSLSLEDWARGGGQDEHCKHCGQSPMRVYKPGEIVQFEASQVLAKLTYTYGPDYMEGPALPEGTTRLAEEYDHENQYDTLDEFHQGREQAGAEIGDTITLECIADWTEYWRCVGELGRHETYSFVPSSFAEYVDQLYAALWDYDSRMSLMESSHRLALSATQAPISRGDLSSLLLEIKNLLKDRPDHAAGGQTR